MPAESFLDTGNRSAFANGGAVVQHTPDFALRVWEAQSCVPLLREGATVVAAWRRLLARARRLGYQQTTEPEIAARMGGRTLAVGRDGADYCVRLPGRAGMVRLRSRAMVPARQTEASDDHRRLGIAVASIVCDGTPIPLDGPALGHGWHPLEGGASQAWRWSDGDAAIVVPAARELRIVLAMTGTYWQAPAAAASAAGRVAR